MKQLLITVLMLASINFAHADSDIFVCTDANGVKTYGNIGDGKGCKKVELPGLTTFSAPVAKKVNKTAPGDFPKVDDYTQKKRDSERKQILSDELKAEQKKYDELNAEYKNGEPDRQGGERNYAKYQERTQELKENLNRSQQNIDALQRELGN
jgi:hypothetical protein